MTKKVFFAMENMGLCLFKIQVDCSFLWFLPLFGSDLFLELIIRICTFSVSKPELLLGCYFEVLTSMIGWSKQFNVLT